MGKFSNVREAFWYTVDLLLPFKWSLSFLGYPLHRGEAYRPFFIIGSPRSGNTLLRRILYAHPDLHIPPESYVLGKTIRLFRQYRTMNWPDLVYFILAQFEFHSEFETFEISLRPLAQRLIHAPENSRSLAFILDSLYRYHAEMKGIPCQRWGDKTPLNIFVLEKILSVFPDAQFIHVVRDGVDVVSSYLEANFQTADIDRGAKRWLSSIKEARRFIQRHPALCLEIRYEELVREPLSVILEICKFLNIEYNPQMMDSHKFAQDMGDVPMRGHHVAVSQPFSTLNIGKGRQQLSLVQKRRLQDLIGQELVQLGYEPAA
jgi:protein-tyrosine sulfotransferase